MGRLGNLLAKGAVLIKVLALLPFLPSIFSEVSSCCWLNTDALSVKTDGKSA